MMQRNSGGSQRIIILVAVVAVLFVGVLYFMKRVEANRLSGSLETLQVSTMAPFIHRYCLVITRDQKNERCGHSLHYVVKF